MASVTKATQDLKFAISKTATVKAAKAVTQYFPVTLNTDGTVQNSIAGDNPIGLAVETGAAGAKVAYWLLTPGCILPAIFSPTNTPTGVINPGDYLQVDVGNDGVSKAPTPGGGTILHYTIGRAYDPGAAGDLIGVIVSGMAYGAAT